MGSASARYAPEAPSTLTPSRSSFVGSRAFESSSTCACIPIFPHAHITVSLSADACGISMCMHRQPSLSTTSMCMRAHDREHHHFSISRFDILRHQSYDDKVAVCCSVVQCGAECCFVRQVSTSQDTYLVMRPKRWPMMRQIRCPACRHPFLYTTLCDMVR